MLLFIVRSIFIIFSVSASLSAQRVLTMEWDSKHASPPVKVAKENQMLLKMVRAGAAHLPETHFMQLSSGGAAFLGLGNEDATRLGKVVSAYYKRMKDEAEAGKFPKISSAVAYCYSAKKPVSGYANVYVPAIVSEKTSVILFLHGYGGSFSFYLHYFATLFPESIVICPAYGISMASVPDEYLNECLGKVSEDLKLSLTKPVLVGLSAGGRGGFRHYARCSDLYVGYVSIVSYPPKDVVAKIPRDAKLKLIAGGDEVYVKNGLLALRMKQLKLTSDEVKIVKDQGHFLMLEDEGNTREWLKDSIQFSGMKK